MEANDYRHTEEIASVLSQDDHFVDASTHKVNSSLRTDHVLSPALLYIIFPKEQLFSHLPLSSADRAVVFFPKGTCSVGRFIRLWIKCVSLVYFFLDQCTKLTLLVFQIKNYPCFVSTVQEKFRQKNDVFTITYLQYIHGNKNICTSINVWFEARHVIMLTSDT